MLTWPYQIVTVKINTFTLSNFQPISKLPTNILSGFYIAPISHSSPLGAQSLSISCSFGKNRILAPPPTGEILHLPLEVEWVIQQSITLSLGIKVSVCAHWLIHQSTAVSGAQLFLLRIRCNKIGKQRPTERYKMSGVSAIGLTKIKIRVRIIGSIFVLLRSALWSMRWHVSKVISNNTSHHAKDQFTLPKPKYFVSKYFTLSQ